MREDGVVCVAAIDLQAEKLLQRLEGCSIIVRGRIDRTGSNVRGVLSDVEVVEHERSQSPHVLAAEERLQLSLVQSRIVVHPQMSELRAGGHMRQDGRLLIGGGEPFTWTQ